MRGRAGGAVAASLVLLLGGCGQRPAPQRGAGQTSAPAAVTRQVTLHVKGFT